MSRSFQKYCRPAPSRSAMKIRFDEEALQIEIEVVLGLVTDELVRPDVASRAEELLAEDAARGGLAFDGLVLANGVEEEREDEHRAHRTAPQKRAELARGEEKPLAEEQEQHRRDDDATRFGQDGETADEAGKVEVARPVVARPAHREPERGQEQSRNERVIVDTHAVVNAVRPEDDERTD